MAVNLSGLSFTEETIKSMGFKPGEYERIVNLLGRHPNINELGMFSVMWSEHCSYKYSKRLLDQFPTCGDKVICGPGENAGVIDAGDGINIVFKVESHNHPTAVEPFQGATTGVGGILRDIFTMGARPIANLNSLHFGELTNRRNKYLFSNAVAGIAWYGNCVGVPTVGGECWFDDSFSGNPLVNAMCVGVLYDQNIMKSAARGAGNSVIYVGSDTGRDGMGGASFASREITDESQADRPAVQVGDPFKGKLLIEACLEAFKTNVILAAQDMGAAGLTCSISEMASGGDVGILLDLDRVPAREENMTPYEFLISESQERMLLVVEKDKEDLVINIFDKWGLNAVIVGEVLEQKRLIVKHKGETVVNIPADVLTTGAPVCEVKQMNDFKPAEKLNYNDFNDIKPEDIEEILLKMLCSLNLCSRKWVFEQYDRQVQNNSILHSEHNTSAMVRLRDKHGQMINKGIALSMDSNSKYTYLDPYEGAVSALVESARNVVCVGAKPVAITNNLNFGNPENDKVYWQLARATKGIADACVALNISVTGGNVSLYNETNGDAIYPTPVIGMVGLIEDVSLAVTPEYKNVDDLLILVGPSNSSLDGSEYLNVIYNKNEGLPSKVDLKHEVKLQEFCLQAIKEKHINSCSDVSEGGLLIAISENAVKSGLGVRLNEYVLFLSGRIDESLFGEAPGRLLITVNRSKLKKIEQSLNHSGLQYNILGKIQKDFIEIDNSTLKVPLQRVKETWETALQLLLKT